MHEHRKCKIKNRQKRKCVCNYLDEKPGRKNVTKRYHGFTRDLDNHPVFLPWVELFRKSWCDKMAH